MFLQYRDEKYIGSTGGLLQNDMLQCNNTVQGRYSLSDSRGKISQPLTIAIAFMFFVKRTSVSVYQIVCSVLSGMNALHRSHRTMNTAAFRKSHVNSRIFIG